MERIFKCGYCQRSFLFYAEEQEFFLLKCSEAEQAQKCEHCSIIRRHSQSARDNSVVVECQNCSGKTRVPFSNNGYKAVTCSQCLHNAYRLKMAC